MQKLTPQQQKDLEIYRKSGELGSLKYILIEDCLEIFKNDYTAQKKLQLSLITLSFINDFLIHYKKFEELDTEKRIIVIMTLLSKGVIPFLDKKITYSKYIVTPRDGCIIKTMNGGLVFGGNFYFETVETLDHLLYCEFTEALRVGKGSNEALKEITKTYINQIYVR